MTEFEDPLKGAAAPSLNVEAPRIATPLQSLVSLISPYVGKVIGVQFTDGEQRPMKLAGIAEFNGGLFLIEERRGKRHDTTHLHNVTSIKTFELLNIPARED